ncbi:MAG: HRDC domain-containing protein [Planctomycetota bacterium]
MWAFDRDGRAERVQVELDRALARLLLGAVLDLCEEKGVEPTLELIVQHATRGGGLPFGLAGLLRAAHAQDVRSALRRMIALGFLRRENEGRLGLTFLGLDVLEGRLQHDAGMGLWRVAFPPAGDPELVERLRSYRTERAAALEVRPYRVLTDRQIHTVAHAKPRTLGTLAALPRVGPMTVATVGSDLIRLVTNYLEDFPARVPYGSGTDR